MADDPITVINEVFGENSIMHRVAYCESRIRQFDANGEVLKGITGDLGLFQLAPQYWLEESIKLNYDVHTTRGNALMASYILKTQGINAWLASKTCWSS